jgi:hypothetical protein
MLDVLIRDETLVPSVGRRFGAFHARLDEAHDVLIAGRDVRGHRGKRVGAVIRLALKFESWRALCREGGLDDAAAAELVKTLVDTASSET